MALLLALAVVLPGAQQASAGTSAHNRDCATDTDVAEIDSQVRCLNGRMTRTRGFIGDKCLKDVRRGGQLVISNAACGKSPERIAQARLVQHLSDQVGVDPAAAKGIQPGVQFEVQSASRQDPMTHGGRADVVSYVPGAGDPRANLAQV